MNLPKPNEGIIWKQYQNETPTFDLTPVEKPDFSPFLIHMTGKNSLVKILKGENKPDTLEVPERNGYLKACKPSFDGKANYYNSDVVCFTETPVFALDFFRYRSYRRWKDNQQFGIGFSKTALIKHRNVRPVIYLDTDTNSKLLSFCNHIINGSYEICNQKGEKVNDKELFNKIKPLLFPLLEETKLQGFMWEREWRCSDSQGLVFPYKAIKIICCPSNERQEIIDVLGEQNEGIEIVESWREYDDVTNYLKRRQKETNSEKLVEISQIKNSDILEKLKNQNDRTLNTLEAYYGVFKETVTSLEGMNIEQIIGDIKQKSKEINEQLKKVEDEIRQRDEQVKNKK